MNSNAHPPIESQENSITAANHEDLISFEQAGQDFFSNFGTKKSSSSSSIIRKPTKTNEDVDLLGLHGGSVKEAIISPTSQTKKMDLSNSNFFAEFGM